MSLLLTQQEHRERNSRMDDRYVKEPTKLTANQNNAELLLGLPPGSVNNGGSSSLAGGSGRNLAVGGSGRSLASGSGRNLAGGSGRNLAGGSGRNLAGGSGRNLAGGSGRSLAGSAGGTGIVRQELMLRRGSEGTLNMNSDGYVSFVGMDFRRDRRAREEEVVPPSFSLSIPPAADIQITVTEDIL